VFTSSRECPPGGGSTWSSHNRVFSRAVMPIFSPPKSARAPGHDRLVTFCFEFQAVENLRC
jgi:hypothetical protein